MVKYISISIYKRYIFNYGLIKKKNMTIIKAPETENFSRTKSESVKVPKKCRADRELKGAESLL